MTKLKTTTRLIITSMGTDSAASSAMVILKYPASEIMITNVGHIPWTIEEIGKQDTPPNEIYICGVGVYDDMEQILEGLRVLKKRRVKVIWYCGRGFMFPLKEYLSPLCKAIFKKQRSNTDVVYQHLQLPENEHTQLLLELGREFAEKKKKISKSHKKWHELIHISVQRYFRYGDRESFPRSIRKLARILPVTNSDWTDASQANTAEMSSTLIGASDSMKRLRDTIKKIAPIEETVLILGPSGSGKELVAQKIHESSPRADKEFIPVNCAIFSENSDLAHDRLFGHVSGAYTGAKSSSAGAFETANGGTLFLDEVAELPIDAQTSLLRVLDERLIQPLGTVKTTSVDVRIIAATNQNLLRMVYDGKFRLDLYYRLYVLAIHVEPLSARKEDMKAIAASIIKNLNNTGHSISISKIDWESIYNYSWPGNVRQFINTLKRAAYLNQPVNEVLQQEILWEKEADEESISDSTKELRLFRPRYAAEISTLEELQLDYMKYVFNLLNNNWTQTAKALNISPTTLRKWLD